MIHEKIFSSCRDMRLQVLIFLIVKDTAFPFQCAVAAAEATVLLLLLLSLSS